MSEKTLFKSEEPKSRREVAEFLRAIADKLDGSGEITLSRGGDEIDVVIPEKLTFEVKLEEEAKAAGGVTRELELELEWTEGAGQEGEMSVS